MVSLKRLSIIPLIFLLLPIALVGKEPRIRVLVDENGVPNNEAFTAQIEINVPREQEVDAESFELDGSALEVQLVSKQTGYSSTLINGQLTEEHKTTYKFRFEMPPKEVGIHVIPPVSVRIDGRSYASQATTYRVVEPVSIPEFTLETAVEGKVPVFPGQELEFIYSLRAPVNISLDREYLPLLQAEGFRLIGERVRQSDRVNGGHHWVIRQKVLALTPGTYRFGPSYFEGYLVKRSFFGGTQAVSERLRASAPVVSIVVNPFPSSGKPSWFDGALGSFEIKAELLSPQKIGVGDRILVKVSIEGEGELSTVKLPKITQQPGFDSFRVGDLQGIGKEVGQRKEFTVELRPLDNSVTAVPPINFAFYEPDTGDYKSVATQPIALTVETLDQPPGFVDFEPSPPTPSQEEQVDSSAAVGRIPIAGNMPISALDLQTQPRGLKMALITIAAALGLLGMQILLKRQLLKRALRPHGKHSQDWLAQARVASDEDHAYAPLIEKALMLRLVECKHCSSLPQSIRDIPKQGCAAEVRAYLLQLEAERYAGKSGPSKQSQLQKAQELYDRL